MGRMSSRGQSVNNRVGFGICEIPGDGHPDYIVSGGAQTARALVDETSWFDRRSDVDQVYSYPGGGGQYDGLRL